MRDALEHRLTRAGLLSSIVDLYRSFAEPLFEETLFRWHRTVLGDGSSNAPRAILKRMDTTCDELFVCG